MLKSRAALPIAELKSEILHLLKENDVLVICGETGCGKTTQVKINAYLLLLKFTTGPPLEGFALFLVLFPLFIYILNVPKFMQEDKHLISVSCRCLNLSWMT